MYKSNCLFTGKGTSTQPFLPDAPELEAHQSITHEFLVSPSVIQHSRACSTWQEVLGKLGHVRLVLPQHRSSCAQVRLLPEVAKARGLFPAALLMPL